MCEKNKKNSSLTIRVEFKTKENLKEMAKNRGLTLSELVNQCLIELVQKENFKSKHKDKLEKRVVMTEKKLLELKRKLGGADNE